MGETGAGIVAGGKSGCGNRGGGLGGGELCHC